MYRNIRTNWKSYLSVEVRPITIFDTLHYYMQGLNRYVATSLAPALGALCRQNVPNQQESRVLSYWKLAAQLGLVALRSKKHLLWSILYIPVVAGVGIVVVPAAAEAQRVQDELGGGHASHKHTQEQQQQPHSKTVTAFLWNKNRHNCGLLYDKAAWAKYQHQSINSMQQYQYKWWKTTTNGFHNDKHQHQHLNANDDPIEK